MTGAVARARSLDLRLARVHLRLGSLFLARAELESLAARGELDGDGIVDLAEVRWRTGDLTAAGEAAEAALVVRPDDPLAIVISAEAIAAGGRPGDARRLATKALALADGRLDEIFAGMRRSQIWPADSNAPAHAVPETLFGPPTRAQAAHFTIPGPGTRFGQASGSRDGDGPQISAADGSAGRQPGMSLWDLDAPASTASAPANAQESAAASESASLPGSERAPEAASVAAASESDTSPGAVEVPAPGPAMPSPTRPDPASDVDVARRELDRGDVAAAAIRLGVTLRIAPELAGPILEAIEGRAEPALELVRGDAYRSLGHEVEANRAYGAARNGLIAASAPIAAPRDNDHVNGPTEEDS